MAKSLERLFDYQKFEQNERLAGVIESTLTHDEIDDDDLADVAGGAAFTGQSESTILQRRSTTLS